MGCYYTHVSATGRPPLRSPLLKELGWRGLISDVTRPEELDAHLLEGERAVYVGFDPTADSLHIGSLLPLLALRRVQDLGHRPIVLIGGGTGLIGDPAGKTGERPLTPEDQVAEWAVRLKRQVERFMDFGRGPRAAVLADNYEWLAKLRVIAFLRDVGKHFPLGTMIAKESVRSRMGRSDEGISYTEFSYQVLQAYDFMALHERHGCTLQLGGTDQWGNITAGIELIKRVRGAAAFGLTLPLVTKADGSKFGKTEAGTVWLDASRTSPYEMYQFWLNTADDDVAAFLKYFTFLSLEEIEALAERTRRAPEAREAQRALARAVTALCHGDDEVREAEAITRAFFAGEVEALSESQLERACRAMPTTALGVEEAGGVPVLDLLARLGLAESRKKGRELIAAGAIHINGQRVEAADETVSRAAARFGRYLIVRKGKKTYHAATLP
jgi:tyrosyl-tRNA synthetase